jgi:hypothetical protein
MSDTTHSEQLIASATAVYTHARKAAAFCANERSELAEPHRLRTLYDVAETHLLLGDLLTRASPLSRDAAALAVRAADASLEAYSQSDAPDVLRTLYSVTAQAKHQALIFTGDLEADEADSQLAEALRETFPASDPIPPPTQV